MNWITRLFAEEWVHALAWTLLHTLWQGLLIALLLALAFTLLRHRPPQVRYGLALGGLLAMVLAAVATFSWLYLGAPWVDAGPVSVVLDNGPGVVTIDGRTASSTSWWASLMGPSQTWLPMLALAWMVGVAVLTLRSLGELLFLQHLRWQRSRPAEARWQDKLDELADAIGLPTAVELRESLWVHTPMVLGFLKPVVLMPAGLLAQLPARELEMVLAHELAHIRRHDYLVNLLQTLAEILFFFNPAVWWVSSLIRAEREHCCDDAAVSVLGDERAYVRTLGKMETYRQEHLNLALGLSGPRGSVLGRMQRMLNGDQPTRVPFRLFWTLLFVLGCGLLLAWQIPSAPQPKADTIELAPPEGEWRETPMPDGREERIRELEHLRFELQREMKEIAHELQRIERERGAMQQELNSAQRRLRLEQKGLEQEHQLAMQEEQLRRKQVQFRLQQVKLQRQRLEQLYQRELAKDEPDEDRIQELEKDLLDLEDDAFDLQNEMNEVELDLQQQQLEWEQEKAELDQDLLEEMHEQEAGREEVEWETMALQQTMEKLRFHLQNVQEELERLHREAASGNNPL